MDSRLRILPRARNARHRSGDAESQTEPADGRAGPREQAGETVKHITPIRPSPEREPPRGDEAVEAMLPGKTAMEIRERPYPKPTQVVKLSKLR